MATQRDYYLPEYRYTEFDGAGTLALWTPRGSAAITITGISLGANAGGTLLLAWSRSSSAAPGAKIMTFSFSGSATTSPNFGPVYGTIGGATLWGAVSSVPTNGLSVTVFGYEVDNGPG